MKPLFDFDHVRAAPKNADVHNNYGFALMAAGRHAEAVPFYELRSCSTALNQRQGIIRLCTGRIGEDKAALRVLRAGVSNDSAQYNLALAQELRGDPERALATYKLALKANPDLEAATQAIARLSETPKTEVSSEDEEQE